VLKPLKHPGKNPVMKKRILLADDDPGIREMLGRVLESEQYEVALAGTGREAVARFAAHPPDLILLDLNMPDLDGWEAIDRITRSHPFASVIVITARPKQYEQAAGMFIDAFMEKPLDLAVLLAAIADLVAESEAERAARLLNPDFKTQYLKSPGDGISNGAGP
jgi:CheY-like chemotaxis protein